MTKERFDERSPASLPLAGRERKVASGEDLVLVGEFGRAHGLKGEVRLKSHTADPQAIGEYGPLITESGRTLVLKNLRRAPGPAPDMLIGQVDGVTSREAAEALNRVKLHVPRNRLSAAEDEDEFLLADLIGSTAVSEAGETIGTVVAVPNFGGGDLVEIAPAHKGPTALLAFTKAFVPHVDIAAKRIVVAAPDDFFEPAKPTPEDIASEDIA